MISAGASVRIAERLSPSPFFYQAKMRFRPRAARRRNCSKTLG